MNHIYKVIWNTITQTWVAVSELSRAKGKTKSSKTLSAVVLAAVSAGAIIGDAEAATNFVQNQTGIAITRSGGDAPATASDRWAIAVGDSAKANSEYSIAVGGHTNATGESAIAIGKQTKAEGQGATAVGRVTLASAQYSSAYGAQAKATGDQSTALGYVANAGASNSLAAGALAQAQGESSVALGRDAQAWGSGASAVGEGSRANNSNAFAGGNGAQATGSWATAVGPSTLASGEASAAYGDSSEATGKKSIATGSHASASAENAIAIGNSTKAQANNTIAIGNGTKATDKSENSLVIGQGAVVTAKDATVVGPVAQANGENATAVGRGAAANGTESTALGRGSVATGNQSIALGKGANAKVDSGVALGDDSVADRTARSQNGIVINTSNPSKSTGFNTENSVYAPVRLVDDPEALNLIKNTIKGNKGAVSVGDSGNTRQIINVAAGSADSDAVNVAQLKAVVGTIKHYNVTSKDGDITIDPDTTDPNKTVWDLKINPKYKIKYFSVKSEGGANQNNDGATATDAIAIGKNASSTGSSAVSLGLGAKALGANNTAIGAGAQAKDVRTTAIGYNATAEAASAVGIGYEAHATQSRSLAIGQDATASANNAIALGSSGQQLGNDRPNKTTASAEYAVAIGSGAVANITNGIALGSQSKTTQDKGQVGFDASQDVEGARTNKYDNLKNNVQNVRTSTLAGLSIGDTGKTRQINHLAAGTADDDAVNVAQLKSVNLAFKGDNNTKGDVRLHDQRLSVVGAQNSFITTKASDNKLEIGTTQGTFSTADGKSSSTKQGLATTTAVASAINDSGWEVQAKGTKVGLVNPGDKVDFTNADNSIEIESSAEANGLSTIKFKAVTAKINTEKKHPVEITINNGITTKKIDKTKQATPTGKFVVPTGDDTNKYALATAYDVADKVNQTGWNLYTNGGAPALINPGDYVNFKSGNATNANVVAEASEGATISYDVNVDNTTIKIDPNGNKLTANTVDLTVNKTGDNAGKVETPADADKGKLVTAENVAKAINENYWVAKRGDSVTTNEDSGDGDSNVAAGNNVTFVAGKNMALKKAGNTFTYGTKDNVSFTTVTSNGVTVNDRGSLTVGAGSTINMGNNIVGGVANGVADTDAVNVAQLKANTSVVSAGDNITVTPSTNAEGNKVYTVAAKNTQATVSKAEGDNPITLDNSTTNANGTTNYKVGLNIDEGTLEVKDGKLTAKAQAKAIETVESKEGGDNIAQVDVKSGKAKGDAGATYQVSVTKNDVKDVAKEAVDVRGSDFITVTPTDGEHLKTHTVAAKTGTIAVTETTGAVTSIATATGLVTDKTVADAIAKSGFQLKQGEETTAKTVINPGDSLTFKDGQGTKAVVNANGDVQVNANVASLTGGDNVTVKDNGNGSFTINAKDTNTQASVSKAANSPITINATGADNAKNYELDVAVDGTTIVKKDGKLTANVPDVSTTDLTVNNGKVTEPGADDGKKLVNATTVAKVVNNSYWKATRGTSDNTNDDKAEGDATSNIKAGDELTFVAGKNMALKKAGNTFTYGTKDNVSFTTVTSNGVTVNDRGSLTVGAGSTINMGNNIVGGVANGIADTDAVNVAQLKANTTTVVAGENITVTSSTNTEGNKVYTVAAKNTQATVSKADGDNPITLDNSTTNANGTTNYKVGLNIDEGTLEVKDGKLTAKAQAKAIETVESKEGGDNIAQVDVKSGKAKGDAGATYQVNVSKNTVKDAAQEAVTVSDDRATNTNSPITVTASKNEANHSTDYKVSFNGNEAAKVIPLTYKANGENAKTVKLSEGLDFTDGKGTKASVGENGKVTFDATVADVKQGDNVTINKDETTGVYTVNAKDTITTVKGKDGSAAKVTTATESTDTNKIYEVDVNVDGTTIVNEGGTLKAKLPDVSTTNLTVNEGKVTEPSADNGKKLVNAATVANIVNNSYWKATRGESNSSNDDKAEDGATSNIKAGDELTFVAGKNMALKKAGNTFTYGTKDNVSFTTVTSNGVTVNDRGSLTVGAGSTINMGNNIVGGVANGIADTDAVNVAQLKANTTTVVAGKNVSVDVAENASTGKTFTVNADKTTVSGTGPVSVKATSDAANHTTNYNVEFDSSKAAEQTDLTYKANGKDAKKVKLSEGLDFTNGKGTKASVGDNGKVTFDATVADVKQGDNVTINKDETTGVYTVNAKDTITTVKGKNGSAAKVTTATGSTDTNKIYEVDVNVDGKTIVNENGTLQAKGWKTKVVKGEGEVEGASEETVNGSDTVNYIAGKNVKLVQDGKNFTIATKDNVTFKDTTTTNLSVTPGGKVDMGNNKVTNVAEGTENTDAVNVKQLKDFKAEVADGGLTFAGNSGTAHKAKLNTTVNIKGGKDNTDATQFDDGKNVMTTVNNNTVTVAIKKTPEVEGINIIDKDGKVKVKLTQTNEGLKVSDGNDKETRITNVAEGKNGTDAVNVKQLNAAKTELTAGDNIDVRSSTGANGQTIYKVSANDTSAAVKGGSNHVEVTKAANTHKDGSTTVTDYTVDLSKETKEDIKKGVDAHTEVTTKGLTFNADHGTTGVKKLGSKVAVKGDGKNITTTANENGVTVSMEDNIKVNSVTAKEVKVGDVNINENGINAGGKRITNVAPGKDGTDAVNVNQLKYVAGNISNQINNVDKGLRAGIAGALASGGLYHVTTAGKSMVSVGAGTYRGQNALAVGYSRLSDNGKVGVKFTVNSNSQGHSGASASVGYQW